MTDHASTINCQHVSVTFAGGVVALSDVSLQVRSGEIYALIGPSGCGKTTLLRLMAGLQVATAGGVVIDPPADSRAGEIAFVFQQPSLLPWRTALQNVMLPLQLIGYRSAAERKAMATELLAAVSLSDAVDRFPRQLSGGMKMRVSIARALVTQPSVLLLDEPFAALDDMLRNQLGQLFLRLWEERQFTAVMVTHNIAESIMVSHRIGVMRAGRLSTEWDNPLPRPRDETLRSRAEFGHFYGHISDALRGHRSRRREADGESQP